MGTLTEDNGTTIELGKKLCRGSWNARPWGPLDPAMVEGLDSGTDLYFNKSESARSLTNGDRFYADITKTACPASGAAKHRSGCTFKNPRRLRCSSAA